MPKQTGSRRSNWPNQAFDTCSHGDAHNRPLTGFAVLPCQTARMAESTTWFRSRRGSRTKTREWARDASRASPP